MSKFTEQDAIELKMPLELLQSWNQVMNYLWRFFTAYSEKENSVVVSSENNTILYKLKGGHQFVIYVNFVNKDYLDLQVEIKGIPDFKASITHIEKFDEEGIIRMVAEIVTQADKIIF